MNEQEQISGPDHLLELAHGYIERSLTAISDRQNYGVGIFYCRQNARFDTF